MRHLKTYLAILGGSYLVEEIITAFVRRDKKAHASRIWLMQAKVSMEIDIYESRWGKKDTEVPK